MEKSRGPKWSKGARWAVFSTGVAWGVMLALVGASMLGIGYWPSLERIFMLISFTSAVGLMEVRRTGPLMNAFRHGGAAKQREIDGEESARVLAFPPLRSVGGETDVH